MKVLRNVLKHFPIALPAVPAAMISIAIAPESSTAQVIAQAPAQRPHVPFTLTSPDVKSEGALPNLHSSCNLPFNNKSPALEWSGAPEGTKSFVVTLQLARSVRGAEGRGWLAYDIPATSTSLPRDAGNRDRENIPGGGTNSFLYDYMRGYMGPCPDSEYPGQYSFVVHALSIARFDIMERIDRHKDDWRDVVRDSLKAYTLDTAFLRVRFRR